MSRDNSMPRAPSADKVRGDTETPSFEPSINHPQKRSSSNLSESPDQTLMLLVSWESSSETWPSRFSGSAGLASRNHPPVFLTSSRPDRMTWTNPLGYDLVGAHPKRLVMSSGMRSSPTILSDATERARCAMSLGPTPSFNRGPRAERVGRRMEALVGEQLRTHEAHIPMPPTADAESDER